jgi:hypothetical protein
MDQEKAPQVNENTEKFEYIITPVFGKYVTRNSGFGDELDDLLHVVSHYVSRLRVSRSLNVLMGASPGSGKSFLIKQITEQLSNDQNIDFKIDFTEIYVPSLRGLDDLIDVFRHVQSSNLSGRMPLVLFDEVDTQIDSRHVFPYFLAPMWDGSFHYGKESFALGKVVFFFAGSALFPSLELSETEPEKREAKNEQPLSYYQYHQLWIEKLLETLKGKAKDVEKLRDFMDRLDYRICIPPVHERLLGQESRIFEQMDVACLLVKKHFSHIQQCELAAALVLVRELIESASRRSAESCVFNSVCEADIFTFKGLPRRVRAKYENESLIKETMGKSFSFRIANRKG